MSTKQNRKFGLWMRTALTIVIILAAATWIMGAVLKFNMMEQYPAQGQLVDVDGFKMHIYCAGKGHPTVILSAGLDDFSIFWSSVQPEVAETTRVCSYDRAGLGWSEASSDPRTSGVMVNELHKLLINANIHPPYILAGHSFGGALIRLYAHSYPDEVAGMVLIDAAPDDLFIRIPSWRNAIDGKVRFYRTLVPMSSFGLLTFTPGSIPNRGMSDDVLSQYRAVAVSTDYFQTGVAENEGFENNLGEVRNAHLDLGNLPLIVISRGYWEPMPGFSDAENQQAWQIWQEMQSELLSLSSNGRQIIARESGHNIQLEQPGLVIKVIKDVINIARK
jgi:pimeloyl-ACP methyl ester carboxylesterase